jgi:ABC-type sugar transport system ATPase subunit/ribose/xylose/arabinose/galactoside ABC-type transport system permease subunit
VTTLLAAAGIAKSFGAVHALRGVTFDVRAGEVHALVGENGAGKSTLIRIISGAETPDAGTLEIGGRHAHRMDPATARALGIAAIYQQPSLFPDLTVAENIALAVEPAGLWRRVRWGARRAAAERVLARVGAAIAPGRLAGTLTLPEQQLVEIAKAIGLDARVFVMDEPSASLTDAEVTRLFEVVRRLRADGAGIIYVSHRLEEVAALADRVTVLRDGETIATLPRERVSRAAVIELMVGRQMTAAPATRRRDAGPVARNSDAGHVEHRGDEPAALELRHVTSRAAGIDDVSLAVRRGEIVGVAGLVGAGRTQLAETVFGLTPADAGTILRDGNAVRIATPAAAIAHGIAYLPEDRRQHGVVLPMAIASNTTLASLATVSRRGLIDRNAEAAHARGYVDRLRIKASSVAAPADSLSGGNQQKVALARWLSTQPAVLILDEPTQGIDVGAKAEIHAMMDDLAAQGLAIVMISSDLPEVLAMSDRVIVMRGGRIAGELARADATAPAIMALAVGTAQDERPNSARDRAGESAGRSPSVKQGAVGLMLREHRRELSVATAIVALGAVLAVVAPGYFAGGNLRDLLLANAPVLVAALGATLVVLAGQIDISVGSVFAICGVMAGVLAKAGLPVGAAVLGACLIGAALGALNGALVAYARIPSIVVTLATMVALRDGLRWVTQGAWVQDLPAQFQWLGFAQGTYPVLSAGLTLVLVVAMAWGLRHLAAGRAVYATGSNREAARLTGIDTRAVTCAVFTAAGALTGLAAVLNAVRFNQIPPNAGLGLEMRVIAAVVVGGTAITGGRGTVTGTVLGVILLGGLSPALTFLGVTAHWERALQGLIILMAVAIDAVRLRHRHA